MKALTAFAVTLGVVLLVPAVGNANQYPKPGAKCTLSLTKEYTPSPWTHEMGYKEQATHKFVYGGKNALLGWLELYNEPRDAIRAKQNFFIGMGHGIRNMLGDTIGGVLHVATFPFTQLDVPLPEGGVDL